MGKEVRIRQSDCGQLRLHVGDEVTFYCILIGDNPSLGQREKSIKATSLVAQNPAGYSAGFLRLLNPWWLLRLPLRWQHMFNSKLKLVKITHEHHLFQRERAKTPAFRIFQQATAFSDEQPHQRKRDREETGRQKEKWRKRWKESNKERIRKAKKEAGEERVREKSKRHQETRDERRQSRKYRAECCVHGMSLPSKCVGALWPVFTLLTCNSSCIL